MESELDYLLANHRQLASGDPWGDTMGAWFDVAAELHTRGEDVPAAWEYRPGLGLPSDEDLVVADLRGLPEVSADALRVFGDVLARLASILRAQGKDY